jgi:hypothetical protein
MTSNLTVCVCNMLQNNVNAEFKEHNYFANEVETQLSEKPLWGSQTQEIHYQKTKLVHRH